MLISTAQVCGAEIAISKASFYRVFVYVFRHERHFAWQVQGIRQRNPSLMEVRNVSLRGRRKESDTL